MRDLNDLRFFAMVVQEGSFSAAARRLGVPKSRLSRGVALLETELGVRLLERSTRKVSPTELGQRIYAHARAVVREAEAADETASALRSEPRGLVRVSCPFGFQQVLAKSLSAFLDRHPRLRVHLVITNQRVDLVADGIDIAVRVRSSLDTDRNLQMRKVGSTGSILVASPILLARSGTPSEPAELAHFPVVSIQDTPEPGRWSLTNADGDTSTVAFQPRLSSADMRLVLDAVLAGSGIALLPEIECAAHLIDGRLARVLPAWGVPEGIAHVVFTSKRQMLPGVRVTLEFVVDALKAVFAARR